MREFSFHLPTKGGLRQWGSGVKGQAGLEECYNLVPYKEKLVPYEVLSRLVGTSTFVTWPFPQLFCTATGNFLGDRTTLKMLDANYTTISSVGTSIIMALWSVADFGQYVLFNNGTNVYAKSPYSTSIEPCTGIDLVAGKYICNYKGQIIIGGPTNHAANVVLWGAIGRATVDPVDSVVAGWRPILNAGAVQVVKRLGDHIMVYGEEGVAFLTPANETVPAMQLVELNSLGIRGQAVGGDIFKHFFVRADGMLCMALPNPQYPRAILVQELGYKEFLEDMDDTIVISPNIVDERAMPAGRLYISDGQTSFMLAEDGLCSVCQCPSSVQYNQQEWSARQ
jgi:hypothetical protein